MGKAQFIAEPGIPQFIVTREFAAPRDLLFRAHTDPDLLVRWLGPRDLLMTVDRLEVRDGGRWGYTHYDAEGNTYSFHGLYHGTPSPDGIVQTYEFTDLPGEISLNTITFEDRGGGTLLRQNTVYQSVEHRDGYTAAGAEAGLGQSLDRLDELVTELARTS
ncbi:polyketide cyclase [Actinomadura craniellae]|uniref:Polyketide cyclase n=1 Tax=Actinomadura craniellae TaxID=2231787 RepID=A0A365HAX5_9ACTN|nr:SRPBCC family protein [Actinomadura craniellae]RAY16158.1 polyketide cyclase [Actinomadura craniellae]